MVLWTRIVSILKMNSKMLQMYWMFSKNLLFRWRIELARKLHANFHLSTAVTFLTNPPAVLSTDTIAVYESSDIHDA